VYFKRVCTLALLLILAACGSLPRPFEGNPGATARRLAEPPPARLAVPHPGAAFLEDSAANMLAADITASLVAREVPAVAGEAQPGDWRLVLAAESRGNMIVPSFTVLDPTGAAKGNTEGNPVDAATWSEAGPAILQKAADDAAPRLATLLTNIEAARQQSDPNSLLNRPARLAFTGVTGAPGDGNVSLGRQIKLELAKIGQDTQDSTDGADFVLHGVVIVKPGQAGQQQVEIDWLVDDMRGSNRGKIAQLNDIPTGSLDHFWGDGAVVVAQQAAGGVKEVIANTTTRRTDAPKPDAPKPAPQAGAPVVKTAPVQPVTANPAPPVTH
jgi:hypothetical protein